VVDEAATKLVIGKNVFAGGGTVSDLRKLLQPLTGRGAQAGREILQRLSLLDWRGTLRISELDSLGWLLGPAGHVTLAGPIDGKLSVRRFPDTQVQLSILVPPATALTIGDAFAKAAAPAGQAHAAPLTLEASAKIYPDQPTVRFINVDLAAGRGRFSIANGTISLREDAAKSLDLSAEGNFDAADIETLQRYLPAVGRRLAGVVMAGHCRLALANGRLTAELAADLEPVAIRWRGIFRKPAGHEADALLRLSRPLAGAAGDTKVSLKVDLPEVSLAAAASLRQRAGGAGAVSLTGDLAVKDAGRLAEGLPILADSLPAVKVAGKLDMRATARAEGGKWTFTADGNADELGFASTGPAGREKKAGTPLRFSLAGSAESNGGRKIRISDGEIVLGGSRLQLAGLAELVGVDLAGLDLAGGPGEPVRVSSFAKALRADVTLNARIDDGLKMMFPSLAKLTDDLDASGSARVTARLSGDRTGLTLTGQADLTDTAIGRAGPYRIRTVKSEHGWKTARLGPFGKPAGLKTVLDVAVTAPDDLSQVRFGKLNLAVGDLQFQAEGLVNVRAAADGAGKGLGIELANARLLARTTRVETICRLWPGLADYAPTGDAWLDCRLSRGESGALRVDSVGFRTEKLAWQYRGKDCSLAGELSAKDVELRPAGGLRVGELRTDGLEMRAGENQAWLIADLKNLPGAMEGTVQLLGSRINDKDLADWLSSRGPAPGPAGSAPSPAVSAPGPTVSTPGARGPAGLAAMPATRPSRQEIERLRDRAGRRIELLRRYAGEANVDGRVSFDSARTFDKAVGRYYELNQLQLRVSVDHGQVTASYVAGLDGGTIRAHYSTYLMDAVPIVAYETSAENVIATKDMQPQLALYFPGNTVHGLFNRTETATVPLADVLVGMMDSRYRPHQTGTAKAITTDGVVSGKAAPDFVTRIFPGLNLTEYRYKKMTSFATFHPDGVAENDMVFSGPTYDIYIEGTTDAANIGRYEIGLILLGTPQSAEWNHTYKQGRIPILKLKARIEGGKMHDEKVTYPWPNESLFVIFLRNNIFYRIWLVANGK